MKNLFLALVAIFAISTVANAQNSSSATATADAIIVCPISVTNNANGNLEFGTVTNDANGGNVVVNADGTSNTAVYNNGVSQHPSSAATHAASFEVCYDGGSSVTLTTAILNNFSGGTGTAPTLSALTNSTLPGGVGCICDDVYVGGTMTIADGTTSGTWQADIELTAAY